MATSGEKPMAVDTWSVRFRIYKTTPSACAGERAARGCGDQSLNTDEWAKIEPDTV